MEIFKILGFIVYLACAALIISWMIKTPRKKEVKEVREDEEVKNKINKISYMVANIEYELCDKEFTSNRYLLKDSVEHWCKNVETCPVEPYDMFDILECNAMVPRSYKHPYDEIYFKRIEKYCTYTISKAAVCFLADRTINLAVCTMMCAYLQYQSYKRNLSKITRQDIRNIFPNGLPSEETWKKLWYQQKVFRKDLDSDNLLDYKKCYESITTK
jgi:hypothetical protein